MLVRRLRLRNWRNFREVDVALGPRMYVIGANAVGKSNLLDVFRFLRTLAQSEGGGLQKALKERGGLTKVRSLHARKETEVHIELELEESAAEGPIVWQYLLVIRLEGRGQQRVTVGRERVGRNGQVLLDRPDSEDRHDRDRLTQTHLEQVNTNAQFRVLAEHFAGTTYLHLVPQLLKHAEEISARIPENDPFGQGLMQRLARTAKKTRDARLKRILQALDKAVPLFSKLEFKQDPVSGMWHLEANFKPRPGPGYWLREDQFSDGTLRLIGLLWALQETNGLLLLEEPEISLNEAIVGQLPVLFSRVLRERKKGAFSQQILISTHSDAVLSALHDPDSVLVIEAGPDGSKVSSASYDERKQIESGLTVAEVLLPRTRPKSVEQLGLFETP